MFRVIESYVSTYAAKGGGGGGPHIHYWMALLLYGVSTRNYSPPIGVWDSAPEAFTLFASNPAKN